MSDETPTPAQPLLAELSTRQLMISYKRIHLPVGGSTHTMAKLNRYIEEADRRDAARAQDAARIATLEAQLDKEMIDELGVAMGHIADLEARNNRLFHKAAMRLATIKELEAQVGELERMVSLETNQAIEIGNLRQELAAARTELEAIGPGEWEPVPDDVYNTDGIEVIYVKDALLSIVGEIYVYLPANMRLCRRVPRPTTPD